MKRKNEILAVGTAFLTLLLVSGCEGTGSPIGKSGSAESPPAANSTVVSTSSSVASTSSSIASSAGIRPSTASVLSNQERTNLRTAELKRQAKVMAMLPADPNPDQLHFAISSLFNGALQADLYNHLEYRGESMSGLIPSNTMSTANLAFFGTVVRMFSENPGFLGGKPKRGFNPVIFNNMVKVFFEKVIPVTPDGIMLLPNKRGIRMMALAPDLEARESQTNMRIFTVTQNGQWVGPLMRPMTQRVFLGARNGEAIGGQRALETFATYAHLTPQMRAGTLSAQAYDATQFPIEIPGEDDLGLLDCFRFLFDGEFDNAQDCFKSAGDSALSKAIETGKDTLISSTRGAGAGAPMGLAVNGMTAGAGAVYGALTNAVTVIYNAYFKKEKLSKNTIRRLEFFVDTYTYSPTVKGEVLPKLANGGFVITGDGLIREAKQLDGGAWVALDAMGRPIETEQALGINSISTLDESSGFKLLERYDNPTAKEVAERLETERKAKEARDSAATEKLREEMAKDQPGAPEQPATSKRSKKK